MSTLIKECVDNLCNKFETNAEKEGKIDAKLYYGLYLSVLKNEADDFDGK